MSRAHAHARAACTRTLLGSSGRQRTSSADRRGPAKAAPQARGCVSGQSGADLAVRCSRRYAAGTMADAAPHERLAALPVVPGDDHLRGDR
eukprot:scaffold83917_cov48-Phaeocystis_antarctica.AAC.1